MKKKRGEKDMERKCAHEQETGSHAPLKEKTMWMMERAGKGATRHLRRS
jgi:hypothetical protein